MITSLFVMKGTTIDIPLARVNSAEALWGPDAGTFDPGRWLGPEDEKQGRKEEVKGYRHLLTFAYGPRMCPGRNFAVTELKVRKALISVLIAFNFFAPRL
jgi:cytochrome P450